MKEGYRFLGEYIRQVDIRNKEGKKENLLGVSVQKQFIQSIANTVGTDFTKYKICLLYTSGLHHTGRYARRLADKWHSQGLPPCL